MDRIESLPSPAPLRLQAIELPRQTAARPPALVSGPDAVALMKALRRRWVLAFSLGFLIAITVGVATWYLVPNAKYVARATLHVATRPRRIMFDPKEGLADFRTYQKTQLALVKNRKVLSHALGLPGIGQLPTVREQIDADEWLEEQLRVEFSGGSEVLQISLSGDRADDVTKIVNGVVQSYMSLIVDEEYEERVKRLEALRKLWEKYQGDLDLKRKNLKELAASVGYNDQQSVALAQQFRAEHLSLAQKELLRAQSELLRAQAELDVLHASRAREIEKPTAPQDIEQQIDAIPDIAKLRSTVESLRRKYAEAARIARNQADPSVRKVYTQWAMATRDLNVLRARYRTTFVAQSDQGQGGVSAELKRAQEQVNVWKTYQGALSKDIARLQAETREIGDKGLDLETEREEINIANEVARKVGSEVEAVQVELSAPKRIQVLSDAKVPKKKDELKSLKAGCVTSLGAFAITLLGVSFWEFRARRIDTVDEVVNGLGMRLVGALPALPARTSLRLGKAALEDSRRWQSLLVESVDATRTMLLHASRVDGTRVVMVTSAVKGEGKTSLSCHLATSLARAGRRTLLLDCDLRSPTAHRLFDQSVNPGLCELLRGDSVLSELIRETSTAGLSVLPAGICDASALQALARDGLRNLFDELKLSYDFIIVDSAPVLPVADSLLIGQSVDAVIFSVLREVSRVPTVYAAYERLERLGINMLGAVVTGVHSETYHVSYGTSFAER